VQVKCLIKLKVDLKTMLDQRKKGKVEERERKKPLRMGETVQVKKRSSTRKGKKDRSSRVKKEKRGGEGGREDLKEERRKNCRKFPALSVRRGNSNQEN